MTWSYFHLSVEMKGICTIMLKVTINVRGAKQFYMTREINLKALAAGPLSVLRAKMQYRLWTVKIIMDIQFKLMKHTAVIVICSLVIDSLMELQKEIQVSTQQIGATESCRFLFSLLRGQLSLIITPNGTIQDTGNCSNNEHRRGSKCFAGFSQSWTLDSEWLSDLGIKILCRAMTSLYLPKRSTNA